MKKTIILILILCLTLPLFSCGNGSDAVSRPFSITSGLFGKAGSDEMMEYEGFSLDKGLIRYTFARMRSIRYDFFVSLDQYLNTYGAYYGYQTLGVTVNDSDTFWNSVFIYAGTEGQTFAESAKEYAVAFLKNALIIENLVKKYDYPGLDEENNKKIEEYKQEMIDLYGSEAMFKIELASYPITIEQWEWWERSMLLITEFKNFLYGKEGPLEISSDEFTLIGVKPIEFGYRDYEPTTEPSVAETAAAASEPAGTDAETSQTTAEASVFETEATKALNELTESAGASVTTEPTAPETETATVPSETNASDTEPETSGTEAETTGTTEAPAVVTYSEEAKTKAKEAAASLKSKIENKEITIDEAYASSYYAMGYPNGVSISKEDLKNTFGIDPDMIKIGDVAIAESNAGLFLFCFCELGESDYSDQLNSISNEKFSVLVESLADKIEYKNDGKAFIDSLKITDFAPAAKAKTTTETEPKE